MRDTPHWVSQSKSMETKTEWMIAGVILFIFGLVIFPVVTAPFWRYSTTRGGSHTGYVTAIEQDGFFFHNYTIYFKTDNSSSQEDKYCLQESETQIADSLKQSNKERQLITIHYDGVRGFGLNLCHGDRIVSVETDER
jgi:hypothetical protein